MWRGKREPTVTVTKQDSYCWIGAGVGESNVGKTVSVEVCNHGWTNRRDTALRNVDRSGKPTFAVAEKNLQLGKGDGKDIEMAVTIEICQPNRTCGTTQAKESTG